MTQIWPPVVEPRTLSRQVWGVESARTIPGVGRALDLYGGLISQMPIDAYRGVDPLGRPRLLDDPDPDMVRPTFVQVQIEDYLLHGNAAHLVTARNADTGWPSAVKWFPAHAWQVEIPPDSEPVWRLYGREVDNPDDVVHVQLGADPVTPARGVGLVERFIRSLDRVASQEESERVNLQSGGVPSVAVIAPQKELTETELDEAGQAWDEKFSGAGRRPAILPNGTEVVPLSWSPNDQQATLARQLSLTDTANIFNLDNYWLGAPGSSHTYRSPGPLFLMLLRMSLEPVLDVFEATWSKAWLPRGQRVRFDRQTILTDDLRTTIDTLTKATGRPVMTVDEARTRHLAMAPLGVDDLAPGPTVPDPDPEPSDNPTDEDEES